MQALIGLESNWEFPMACDVYFIAGEKSGDLHAEHLIEALKTLQPQLELKGVAGPRMRLCGVNGIIPMEELQVMGFSNVFFSLPKIIKNFHLVAREILELKPKAVVTIDYPGFNLRLARYLKRKGFEGKCIHFICPSVWAWGKKRIPFMAKYLDLLLTILPFEKALFANTHLKTLYVGHPLIERLKKHSYQPLSLPSDRSIISLFPGSRKKEIESHLLLYLQVAKALLKEDPNLYFALSVSDEKFRPFILSLLKKTGWENSSCLQLIPSHLSYELMKASSFAIAKSGTVTLELALHHVPTVVTYAIRWIDVFIARDLLRIRLLYYCLVNIIANQEIFPELFGPHLHFDSLYQQAKGLLKEEKRKKIETACEILTQQMGNQCTSHEAAQAISSIMFSVKS